MAIRSNVGNVVTNGMQILSVSATNAASRFGRQAQIAAGNQAYQAGVNDMYLSDLQNTYGYGASDIAKAKARDAAAWIKGKQSEDNEEDLDISEALQDTPTAEEKQYEPFTQNEHTENIANKVNSDLAYQKKLKAMSTKNALLKAQIRAYERGENK